MVALAIHNALGIENAVKVSALSRVKALNTMNAMEISAIIAEDITISVSKMKNLAAKATMIAMVKEHA